MAEFKVRLEPESIEDQASMEELRQTLRDWWIGRAVAETDAVVGKAVEYGADDLADIGRELVACGVPDPGRGEEGYAELGIFFYEVGKMARWRSAVRRGMPVSDDTLGDVGIYIRMAQRNREVGGWPFKKEQA